MKTFAFDKIIRDKVYQKLWEEGVTVRTRDLDGEEITKKLKEKLMEEVQEVCEATDKDHLTEELADVLEVVQILAEKNGIAAEVLEEVRKEKCVSRGGFAHTIYVDSITVKEDHPMLGYFLARPSKYPEVL